MRVAISITLFIITLQAATQTVFNNPICYGDPIILQCNLLTGGCGNNSSTYDWRNFSGSWKSNQPEPIILAGQQGYASDRFYLNVLAPPQAGFPGGRVTVVINAKIHATATVTAASCPQAADGSITMSVSGGRPPFTYLWNDGATTKDRSNIPPGDYSLMITDDRGCTKNMTFTCEDGSSSPPDNFTVTSLSTFDATISSTQSICDSANGTATVSPSGGTQPYAYLWDNGDTTQIVTGLLAGEYEVTVSDAVGCSVTLATTVTNEPSTFDVSISKKNLICSQPFSGSIHLQPNVAGTYTYLWTDGNTNRVRVGLNTGTYNVIVTNQCGTSVSKEINILTK